MAYDITESQARLNELTDALKIDKHALDNELTDHAELLNEIGREYARCIAMRDTKKHEHELAIASTDRRLRVQYAKDEVKITEKRLESEVLEHPAVDGAFVEYAMWKHMSEAWSALRDAMSARGYAIRDLCSLHIAGYFAHAPVKQGQSDAKVIGHGRG